METTYSEQRNELFAALSKAQANMHGAVKDTENDFFNSRYADLAACIEAAREPLAENGLCVIQTTETLASAGVTIITTLGHSSGQWMTGRLTMTPQKAGPQPLGACITYARRYAYAAIVGLAQVDDDAESATVHKGTPEILPEQVWTEAQLAASGGLGKLEQWFKSKPKPVKEILTSDGKRWEKLKGQAADIDAKQDEAA